MVRLRAALGQIIPLAIFHGPKLVGHARQLGDVNAGVGERLRLNEIDHVFRRLGRIDRVVRHVGTLDLPGVDAVFAGYIGKIDDHLGVRVDIGVDHRLRLRRLIGWMRGCRTGNAQGTANARAIVVTCLITVPPLLQGFTASISQ